MANKLVCNVLYPTVHNVKTVLDIAELAFMDMLYIFQTKHANYLWFKTVKTSWMEGVKIVMMATKWPDNLLVFVNVVSWIVRRVKTINHALNVFRDINFLFKIRPWFVDRTNVEQWIVLLVMPKENVYHVKAVTHWLKIVV